MINSIQVARGLAALAVVFHHSTLGSNHFHGEVAFNGLFGAGKLGVDFFFILSGFIIYHVHHSDKVDFLSIKKFALKRFIRLYPPFILISLLVMVGYSLVPSLVSNDRDLSFFSSVFLIPVPSAEPALTVSWTLMHELLFYSFFLISYYFLRKFFWYLMLGWGFLILTFESYFYINSYYLNFLLSPYNLQFILGLFVAWAFTCRSNFQILSLLFLFLIVAFSYIGGFIIFSERIFWGCFFGISLTIMILIESKYKFKVPKFLLYFGVASYSIYLIHDPAISVLNRVFANLGLHHNIDFILISLLSVLSGLIYYELYEKKITKYLRRKLL